ncbi:MAG TPA: DUF2752 domain-containing protein [Bacteroidales bacterium]|jgi:hypothetical protein|nr:DUF2752 domain-containing protein [Bacteroidales bacterium]HNV96426.1 DUF2752 domain-containing protein [Bacteroidales bacterium]HOU97240.1 DUF2752 domain-containing protein [Bacteroidales bacterium]
MWYYSFIHWLEEHQGACMYKKFLGIECPGCGMQRSLIALLKGNVMESLQLFPALIPLLTMFLFLILHLVFKFKYGARILVYWFILNTIIIVSNYIIKLI